LFHVPFWTICWCRCPWLRAALPMTSRWPISQCLCKKLAKIEITSDHHTKTSWIQHADDFVLFHFSSIWHHECILPAKKSCARGSTSGIQCQPTRSHGEVVLQVGPWLRCPNSEVFTFTTAKLGILFSL
jgi:hypothetical protein